MKKNYIAPSTDMMNLASYGIMQNPNITIGTAGSGAGTGPASTSNLQDIE